MAVDPADWRELNQAWWDERVPLHVGSDDYDVEGFKAGGDRLRPFEVELLGDVSGLRLAHLQCHFGADTMSWARHGASVVGLDFSQPAVDTANALAHELGLDARFVRADVYDAVDALGGEQFDIVYTGFGALNWLPDLTRWAEVVAALIKPGGRLLLAEFHPISWVFDDEPPSTPAIEHDYFAETPFIWDDPGSYADPTAVTENNATVEHQHTLGDIFTAVLAQGLQVRAFQEYDHTLFPRFPFLERRDGCYRFPEGTPRLPLMFTLLAEAPGPAAAGRT
ncbi:class I SAM-dependent methyltransferase [Aquihabitans sp. McL0605]|uniref:class I SAM-dependent methyltransferase n=1 Tax=Aquihabitans sp. McL0605 TaxID=3415671 RepID=UPI003CE93EE6